MTTMNASPSPATPTRSRNAGASGSTTKSKRKQTSLPPETVEYLKNWMMSPEHVAHPYPTEQEKAKIMLETGIELKQLTNWFVNNRKRYWKPLVEARLNEQSKAKGLPSLPIKTVATDAESFPVSAISQALAKVVSTASMVSLEKSPSDGNHKGTTVTPSGSPGRAVSDTSSTNVSDSDSVSSFEEDVGEQEHTIRIDLHILKPVSGRAPTEEDMTTLSNIPADRVLRSFKNCYITYRIPVNATLQQEQTRREAELLKLKKRLLGIYFAEKTEVSGAVSPNSRPMKRSVEVIDAPDTVSPRPKYRRISIDIWKDACKRAAHAHDESLPSLEEATQLFGFANN